MLITIKKANLYIFNIFCLGCVSHTGVEVKIQNYFYLLMSVIREERAL